MSPPRSVRPIEPAKSTSPPNTKWGRKSSQTKTTEPGLCPGISRTSKFNPARLIVRRRRPGVRPRGWRSAVRNGMRQVGFRVTEQEGLVTTDDEWRVGKGFLHGLIACDMISVAVRVQDRGETQARVSSESRGSTRCRIRDRSRRRRAVPAARDVRDLSKRSRFDRFNRVFGHSHRTSPWLPHSLASSGAESCSHDCCTLLKN